MRRIVITGPQPVDMLDLVGPLEGFKFAPEYEVAVASPEGTTELQLNHGFKISYAVFCLKKKIPDKAVCRGAGPDTRARPRRREASRRRMGDDRGGASCR